MLCLCPISVSGCGSERIERDSHWNLRLRSGFVSSGCTLIARFVALHDSLCTCKMFRLLYDVTSFLLLALSGGHRNDVEPLVKFLIFWFMLPNVGSYLEIALGK